MLVCCNLNLNVTPTEIFDGLANFLKEFREESKRKEKKEREKKTEEKKERLCKNVYTEFIQVKLRRLCKNVGSLIPKQKSKKCCEEEIHLCTLINGCPHDYLNLFIIICWLCDLMHII